MITSSGMSSSQGARVAEGRQGALGRSSERQRKYAAARGGGGTLVPGDRWFTVCSLSWEGGPTASRGRE